MEKNDVVVTRVGPYNVELVICKSGELCISIDRTDGAKTYTRLREEKFLDVYIPENLNPKNVLAT